MKLQEVAWLMSYIWGDECEGEGEQLIGACIIRCLPPVSRISKLNEGTTSQSRNNCHRCCNERNFTGTQSNILRNRLYFSISGWAHLGSKGRINTCPTAVLPSNGVLSTLLLVRPGELKAGCLQEVEIR